MTAARVAADLAGPLAQLDAAQREIGRAIDGVEQDVRPALAGAVAHLDLASPCHAAVANLRACRTANASAYAALAQVAGSVEADLEGLARGLEQFDASLQPSRKQAEWWAATFRAELALCDAISAAASPAEAEAILARAAALPGLVGERLRGLVAGGAATADAGGREAGAGLVPSDPHGLTAPSRPLGSLA